ncbi:MAG: glycoside hydrolase family 3 C-terminal domain-containing protein [bacterium]
MKIKTAVLTVALMALAAALMSGPARSADAAKDKKPAYLDYTLPIDARVADLVKRLTWQEKASFMNNNSSGVPRLNIKPYEVWNEALHGVARLGNFTVFPQAVAMASTWDPDLIYKEATAISDEAWGAINRETKTKGFPPTRYLTWWSPTINMARDPRWGRTPETYGEDPFLTGRIALSFVRGIQGNDKKYLKSVATPKHFAANNEEHNRLYGNAWIAEKTLREYYFPAFRTCVQEGGAMSVMGAYNAVNGVPCNANRWLLTDVLRNEWGFKGFVVTDCGAGGNLVSQHKYAKSPEEAAAMAVKAGVDVECGSDVMRGSIISSMKQRMITKEEINLAVTRLLKARFMLGMFDPPEIIPFSKISPSVIGSPAHKELTRQVSRESIVLLKNDKVNGVPMLPLNVNRIKSVTVVGPNANVLQYGDYSGEAANPPVNPLEGIIAKSGGKFEVNHSEWQPLPFARAYLPVPDGVIWTSAGATEPGLNAEYFNSANFDGVPAAKRIDKELYLTASNAPAGLNEAGPVSVRWKGAIKPEKSGMYYFFATSRNSDSEMYVNGKLNMKFEPVEKKKTAVKAGAPLRGDDLNAKPEKRKAALLLLEAGKTYDIELRSKSEKGAPAVRLTWVPPAKESTALGFDKIRNSDVIIAFMGIGQEDDREGSDRDNIDLPLGADEYIQQLRELNGNIIVVLINGSPLAINWMKENIAAIVEAWYPGEQGGNAIADVLFGDYNPAGRLTMTHYKGLGDLPPFNDYEISRGRTYMYFKNEPLFPFGYGLSYTTFKYSGLSFDRKTAGAADTVKVSLKVVNTGSRDGDEVVQIYVSDKTGPDRPVKRLRGFLRVNVKKGETKTVSIPIYVKDFEYWNDAKKKFEVLPGKYEIQVGASSADIRLKDTITVKAK